METSEMLCFFCKNLKAVRKKNKLTQKEMAKILGIGVASLSSIERGKVPPRLKADIVIKIRQNFGILPSEIVKDMP